MAPSKRFLEGIKWPNSARWISNSRNRKSIEKRRIGGCARVRVGEVAIAVEGRGGQQSSEGELQREICASTKTISCIGRPGAGEQHASAGMFDHAGKRRDDQAENRASAARAPILGRAVEMAVTAQHQS